MTNRLAYLILAIVSMINFAPFLKGGILVGGTDVIFTHFPNLLFGYDEFSKYGRFSLWNPYVFAGMDMTGSMHALHLNPLFWPMFLLPKKMFLQGVTTLFFICNLAVGFCWFHVSRRIGLAPVYAVMVGLVAQSGMFFWFATTTLIAVPMYAFSSIAILLIWTGESRSKILQFLLLSLTFSLILVFPHPGYLIGFALPIIVALLIKEYPDFLKRPFQGQFAIAIIAALFSVVLAAYRLYPVFVELTASGDVVGKIPWIKFDNNISSFILTVFNPIAIGTSIHESFGIATLISGNGRHAQFHNGLYFGIVGLFLVLSSLCGKGFEKLIIPLILFMLLMNNNVFVDQQFVDIVNIVFYPFIHDSVYRINADFAFILLLIMALAQLDKMKPESWSRAYKIVVVVIGLVLMSHITLWARVFYVYKNGALANSVGMGIATNASRIAMVLLVIGTIYAAKRSIVDLSARFILPFIGILLVIPLPLFFLKILRETFARDSMYLFILSDYYASAFVAISVVLLAARKWREAPRQYLVFVLIFFAVCLSLWRFQAPMGGRTMIWTFGFSLVGIAKMLILVFAFLYVVRGLVNGTLDFHRQAFPLLLMLAVFDLTGAYRVYSFVNTNIPFVSGISSLYPDFSVADLYDDSKEEDLPQDLPKNKNLLVNPQMTISGVGIPGWNFGGKNIQLCNDTKAGEWGVGNRVAICSGALADEYDSNLYQDVKLPSDTVKASFGAWMRLPKGGIARLFMSALGEGAASSDVVKTVPDDGAWHWMQANMTLGGNDRRVRPHINVRRGDMVQIYAPRLIVGKLVSPVSEPEEGEIFHYTKPISLPIKFDGNLYRANHVHQLLGLGGESMTSMATVYQLRTYGGVDSDMPKDWIKFLTTMMPPDGSWFSRGGILTTLKDDRLLDLLGVKYGRNEDQTLQDRQGAVPRFAAFPSYIVETDGDHALSRLKDSSFNPITTLVLTDNPGVTIEGGELIPLKNIASKSDTLVVNVPASAPRLIYFGDKYSPGWNAYWNGRKLNILRANFVFMSVVVPPGAGEVEFRFEPKAFLLAVKISLSALTLIGALGIFILIKKMYCLRQGKLMST